MNYEKQMKTIKNDRLDKKNCSFKDDYKTVNYITQFICPICGTRRNAKCHIKCSEIMQERYEDEMIMKVLRRDK